MGLDSPKNISGVESANISRHGLWLLIDDEELFLSFDEFPWFKDASRPYSTCNGKALTIFTGPRWT